jgi:hypothetical protein
VPERSEGRDGARPQRTPKPINMMSSKIFLYFCLSFIGGIFISSFLSIFQPVLLAILILGILLISVFWPFGRLGAGDNYKKITIASFCLLFLALGFWRHQNAELRIKKNELRRFNDSNEIVTLTGVVAAEPDIREKTQKIIIKIENINNLYQNTSCRLKGRVLVTFWKYPTYRLWG